MDKVNALHNFRIHAQTASGRFPDSFRVNLDSIEPGMSGLFVKADQSGNNDVYLIGSNGSPYKYQIQTQDHVIAALIIVIIIVNINKFIHVMLILQFLGI
jgi:hypothetical protein